MPLPGDAIFFCAQQGGEKCEDTSLIVLTMIIYGEMRVADGAVVGHAAIG
jgi:hypothetical protein